jgi:hypothetical protein
LALCTSSFVCSGAGVGLNERKTLRVEKRFGVWRRRELNGEGDAGASRQSLVIRSAQSGRGAVPPTQTRSGSRRATEIAASPALRRLVSHPPSFSRQVLVGGGRASPNHRGFVVDLAPWPVPPCPRRFRTEMARNGPERHQDLRRPISSAVGLGHRKRIDIPPVNSERFSLTKNTKIRYHLLQDKNKTSVSGNETTPVTLQRWLLSFHTTNASKPGYSP